MKKVRLPVIIFILIILEAIVYVLLDSYIVRTLVMIHMYICVHELSHLLTYQLQGIDIYSITVFPVKIINSNKVKVTLDVGMSAGYLGIVIPKIDKLTKEEILRLRSKFQKSILAGSLSNFCLFIFFLILRIMIKDYFISASLMTNLFMVIIGLGQNDYVKGDIIAYYYIKKDVRFYYLIIYTFTMYENGDAKEYSKFFIRLFEDEVILDKQCSQDKRMLYNIFKEQLKVSELCISEEFIKDILANMENLIEAANKKKYMDYAICNKVIQVLLRYNYDDEALNIYESIKNIFPMNRLLYKSKEQFLIKNINV